MKRIIKFSENGQSLVLIALLSVVFLGFLALILDGGNAYLKHRLAQTSADAGALAAANEACWMYFNGYKENPSAIYSAAVNQVDEYSIARNGATSAFIVNSGADWDPKNIIVQADINFNTFFGGILGLSDMTANARARSGCFSPNYGDGVLPIVWACRSPVDDWPSDSTTCQQQRITWKTLTEVYAPFDQIHPELYIVMDSLKTDNAPDGYDPELRCIQDNLDPPGTLDCDFDEPPDGESDWVSRGGSSWIDLDGGDNILWQDGEILDNDYDCGSGGKDELNEWVTTGYQCDLFEHTWIPDEECVGCATLYKAAYERWKTNPIILVPVVNEELCNDDPSNPDTTGCDVHPGDYVVSTNAAGQNYYHIDAFAAFYITCVRSPGNNTSCPGSDKVMDNNAAIGPEFKSIEGYFLTGPIPGLGGKGDPTVDTGVYTIYLDTYDIFDD